VTATADTDARDAGLAELPEEQAWLEGGQSYVVCAFYTQSYLPQITSLRRSLEEHGINHFLKRYERRATWESTTRLKPVFLDYCLRRFPERDVLYLDADAVVRKPLAFFDGQQSDVSLLFHPTRVGGTHYLRISAGTVFVRNTEGGRRFASLWKAQEARCGPLTVDEDMIYMAFGDLAGVSITVLPPTYYKIFDKPGAEPVIEHFQASRRQFKWRRVIRKARRIAVGVAIAGSIALVWWLSRRLTWR
jgi:hypothetical protein